MLLLKYFDSGNETCCHLKCDQCIKALNTTVQDITQLTCDIILCLLSMKRLSPRMFTLKQLAYVITGKCNGDVRRYGYNNADKFGCYKSTVSDAEYILYILVYTEVLRPVPSEVSSRNKNTFYIDLGPQFIYVQNGQLPISYTRIVQ